MAESPDIELLCGGINSKTPAAVGLWRQGHLLHFGFEQSPQELNDIGRDLLVNAVAYISRFTEDRAILFSPSPFVGGSCRSRDAVLRMLENQDYPVSFFTDSFAAGTLPPDGKHDRPSYKAWFEKARDFLHPEADGKLVIDEQARALNLRFDGLESFERGIEAFSRSNDAGKPFGHVLARYVPEGPGAAATADQWRAWFTENREYLFFSEYGGYRWYIDPLAKKRHVPTAALRGPARADESVNAPLRRRGQKVRGD